ncbi:hypothetical protein C8035_v012298 [Colletotrichum spinosum]|uniref:Uncharacterized protein n=1 Tax=Colletotrichum spinosum TaxID=1347390 RepID=A0A4R8Q2A8_9PEZI|nr:hypothetical protein C8035_v012298 [Colletotrichum spinosum]
MQAKLIVPFLVAMLASSVAACTPHLATAVWVPLASPMLPVDRPEPADIELEGVMTAFGSVLASVIRVGHVGPSQ